MPKSLHEWLHYSALNWMMPAEAVQEDHGGIWHKATDIESWTVCGRWVAGANLRGGAGFGPSRFGRRSPWWGFGSLLVDKLCVKCFSDELPIITELQRVAVHGAPISAAIPGEEEER